MSPTWHIVARIATWTAFAAVVIWLGVRSLKRAEDPARLVFKWILSAVVIWITAAKIGPMVPNNPLIGIPLAAVCGLVMAAIWRHSIADLIATPFANLYDGGDEQVDPRAVYSMAMAKRKRGHYAESLAEIQKQLERFPTDFEGQLMRAEIQAENLNDVPGAELTIQRLCNQPEHSPRNIAFALNSLADWHLKFGQDREAARQALEKINELLPDTEMSALASERIAHLADTGHLVSQHRHDPIALKAGVDNIGLLPSGEQPKAPEADPAKQAADYVRHLAEHPLDTDAREKLALVYAHHYGRLDLATNELEQLIAHPNQPARRVVHWLNLLTDLQIEHGANYETVRDTLQRVVDLYPDLAAGETARSRLAHLKLELKGKAIGRTVALGTYEQDIGLKSSRLPHQP